MKIIKKILKTILILSIISIMLVSTKAALSYLEYEKDIDTEMYRNGYSPKAKELVYNRNIDNNNAGYIMTKLCSTFILSLAGLIFINLKEDCYDIL